MQLNITHHFPNISEVPFFTLAETITIALSHYKNVSFDCDLLNGFGKAQTNDFLAFHADEGIR